MTATPMSPVLTATPAAREGLSRRLVALLATGAGFAVAALYYSQPMLGVIGADTGASDRAIGWVPTLTQLGYAFGLLLLGPLGDRYDRRNIILLKAAVLTLALLAAALAPNLGLLLAASLSIGLAATLAQDIVPAAAAMAAPEHRGKIVGTVMTGLLLGILLSRVVAGAVAEHWGWRSMFGIAALGVATLAAVLLRGLPSQPPTATLPYLALLGSLGSLWRRHPGLRRAALAQGLLALGFSAFWSTLAVMLHRAPFGLGAAVAGAFGLAGAVGALAAPLAGKLADRQGPGRVTRLGAALVLISFATMFSFPWLSPHQQLWVLALTAVGFDLGVQASLIAHQTLIYGLEPEARSRLNAVLMVGVFTGMSLGASLGSWALAGFGWMGVTVLASAAAAVALALRLGHRANRPKA
jgi:predicted MFS family arabinose efflux permease